MPETTRTDVQKVTITDRNNKTATGEVKILSWDKSARTKRALKTLGACWAGAVVAVFLPIIHFVLVPGLFLGGIIAAMLISNQESVVLGGQGTCPSCGAPLDIVRSSDKWPVTDQCSKCQSMVTIEKTGAAQPLEPLYAPK